jgi:hypothetical protein
MVRPRTKNGFLKDGKMNIRMETNGEPTNRKTKNKMSG